MNAEEKKRVVEKLQKRREQVSIQELNTYERYILSQLYKTRYVSRQQKYVYRKKARREVKKMRKYTIYEN